MIIIWTALLILLNTFGLVLVCLTLPGIWVMVTATCGFAWLFSENEVFSIWTLASIGLLAAASELIEFLAGLAGARKAGGGRRGSAGALVGCIIGAVFGTVFMPIPIFGTVFGSCLGAGVGAWSMELSGGMDYDQSVKVGVGAGAGRLAGTLVKILIGLIIWVIALIAALIP